MCFEDFPTKEEADAFEAQLLQAWPHLRDDDAPATSGISLYAQPYDISACGFFFRSAAEYNAKVSTLRSDYGLPVEEFEIQFIDGRELDAALFKALGIHQGNFPAFLSACADWDDEQKIRVIVAAGECGYSFDPAADDPDALDVDLYELDSLHALAVQFVEDGLFGDIPEQVQAYLDYDAITRDLGMDYAEIRIAGRGFVYRCG